MRNWLKILLALFPLYASGATVWTWVDEQGRRHYSDREMPGATRVEIGEPQTFSGSTQAPAAASAPASAEASMEAAPEQAPVSYTVLDIISPAQQETIRNTGGMVQVELGIYPPLAPGDRVAASLNGQRTGTPARATSLSLSGVVRGEHRLEVMIIDDDDTVLMRSSPVTIFVHQTSIQN